MKHQDNDPQKIVVAPLDWGFGHATRMLSIVRWLSEEYEIYVAIPESLRFLYTNENVKIISVPGINIRYSRLPLSLSLALQFPKVLIRGFFTRRIIKKAVKRIKPNLIISDNQPFVRHKKITSVYVTHQLNMQHKNRIFKGVINQIHHWLINKYNACWIPDTANHDLAGDLSKGNLKIPIKYIGGISRFQTTTAAAAEKYTKVCILSGPEPERTRWANQMKKKWQNIEGALIIGILQGKDRFKKQGELTLSSHLNDALFMAIIQQADEIISRSGYSTIMDLAYLAKKATFIPTKGQTEQEYLAEYYTYKNIESITVNSFCDKVLVHSLMKNQEAE